MVRPRHFRPNPETAADNLDFLKQHYRVQDVIDDSGLERDGLFLEGTDAMVLERFTTHFNYEPITFDTTDAQGQPVYHTNVLMRIATPYAMVALGCITCARRAIEKTAQLLPLAVPTIELAGGSVRCMLAGIHLSPRQP